MRGPYFPGASNLVYSLERRLGPNLETYIYIVRVLAKDAYNHFPAENSWSLCTGRYWHYWDALPVVIHNAAGKPVSTW